ncbi:MAG: polysaccharide deacetylase family protein [Bacteroidetes bacterium]|nr:polysaccharide deacetylase family protein [Bacteroidota bacterium]
MKKPMPALFSLLFLISCLGRQSNTHTDNPQKDSPIKPATSIIQDTSSKDPVQKMASAVEILAKKQVPILCYHQIRDWKPTDSKRAKDYIVPVDAFKQQMKMLADSGYHSILPDELYDYLTKGTPLPSKPVMLSFDDTDLEQYSIAYPEMQKHHFKGVFFIMTVSLNRPRYMNSQQVKELSDAGNVIGSHTWDHHNVKQYQGKDWEIQIDKPTKLLETITGKPIRYFAYPFGLWNKQAIPELKKRNFVAAFQLITQRDDEDPLFTIRRMIVPGYWSLATLQHYMNKNF